MKKVTLFIIRLGRALFYGTPVHQLKFVNVVYEKLFHAAYGRDNIITVEYEDCEFDVPSRDISLLPSLMNNNYEKYEFKLLKQLLTPGDTFIDVGANIGLFSVVGAKLVGKNGKVYSFEPEPSNYKLLIQNAKANKVRNIIFENLAVGDNPGSFQLHIEENSIGSHSLLNRSPSTIEGKIDVEVVRLDDYFRLSKSKFGAMKVDVEGYEPFVLGGAKKTLERVQYLFFEYNLADIEANFGAEKMANLLASFPYIYMIDEKSHMLKIFSGDDFLTTKYANILASKEKVTS